MANFTADNADTNLFEIKEKKNKSNRKQWHKKCWNNGTIKISKYFLETLELPLINHWN